MRQTTPSSSGMGRFQNRFDVRTLYELLPDFLSTRSIFFHIPQELKMVKLTFPGHNPFQRFYENLL